MRAEVVAAVVGVLAVVVVVVVLAVTCSPPSPYAGLWFSNLSASATKALLVNADGSGSYILNIRTAPVAFDDIAATATALTADGTFQFQGSTWSRVPPPPPSPPSTLTSVNDFVGEWTGSGSVRMHVFRQPGSTSLSNPRLIIRDDTGLIGIGSVQPNRYFLHFHFVHLSPVNPAFGVGVESHGLVVDSSTSFHLLHRPSAAFTRVV